MEIAYISESSRCPNMGSGDNYGDDCENIGLGCALEAFRLVSVISGFTKKGVVQ
jgi:hypothetical protein